MFVNVRECHFKIVYVLFEKKNNTINILNMLKKKYFTIVFNNAIIKIRIRV